jgi:hypothetical protein
MAHNGKEEHFPIWMPENLPEELVAESFVELLNGEMDEGTTSRPEDPNFGFVAQGWFGPFMLSPPTRFLKGQC